MRALDPGRVGCTRRPLYIVLTSQRRANDGAATVRGVGDNNIGPRNENPGGLRGHSEPSATPGSGAGARAADCLGFSRVDAQPLLQLHGWHGGVRKGAAGSHCTHGKPPAGVLRLCLLSCVFFSAPCHGEWLRLLLGKVVMRCLGLSLWRVSGVVFLCFSLVFERQPCVQYIAICAWSKVEDAVMYQRHKRGQNG